MIIPNIPSYLNDRCLTAVMIDRSLYCMEEIVAVHCSYL